MTSEGLSQGQLHSKQQPYFLWPLSGIFCDSKGRGQEWGNRTVFKNSKYMLTLSTIKNHGSVTVQLCSYENRTFLHFLAIMGNVQSLHF